MSIDEKLYSFIIKVVDDRIKEIRVTREEFDKIANEVRALIRTQDRVEESLENLMKAVNELAEAQKRTEERLDNLTETVNKLAEAQKRTEERVNELAEAQKRTEERLDNLTETVNKLAEAQKRTEESVNKLSVAVENLQKEVGSLSSTIGFSLEDVARKLVPAYLEKKFKIRMKSELDRKFFKINGDEIEINFFGIGENEEGELYIIGESKSRLYSSEVNKFYNNVKKIEKTLDKQYVLFIFGFYIHPSAQEVAEKNNIEVIFSY